MRALAVLSVLATLVLAEDDESCGDWAVAGYCESDSHAKYMALHCATACTDQAATAAEGITDESAYAADGDSCADWANAGYCESEEYADYMQVRAGRSARRDAPVKVARACVEWRVTARPCLAGQLPRRVRRRCG
jgi:hypothetical protein